MYNKTNWSSQPVRQQLVSDGETDEVHIVKGEARYWAETQG